MAKKPTARRGDPNRTFAVPPPVATSVNTDEMPNRVVAPRRVSQGTYGNYNAMDPQRLYNILKMAERGDVTELADLVSYVLRSDSHIRSIYETRLLSVVGSKWTITPHDDEDPIEVAGAEFCTLSLRETPKLETMFALLLHAVGLGWSGLEHDWKRIGRRWNTFPTWIHPREFRFRDAYKIEMRTYQPYQHWIRAEDFPNKFVISTPMLYAEYPNLSGEITAILWQWLFKTWLEKFRNSAMERFGNPMLVGKVPRNAPRDVRLDFLAALENVSSDGAMVLDIDSTVEMVEASTSPGNTFNDSITHIDNQMSKSFLGSGLNVEVASTGGNRALGESQFDTTILPRLRGDAMRLANDIEEQWLRPLLEFNAHLFGGQVPRVGKFEFQLVEERANIPQWAPTLGTVTYNELRISMGLPAWADDQGGNDVIQVEAAGGPAWANTPVEADATPSWAQIKHQPGGEWRVVSKNNESLGVFATKAEAIAKLQELEQNIDGAHIEPVGEVPQVPLSRSQLRRLLTDRTLMSSLYPTTDSDKEPETR